jgi:CHAT domain-containing protein/tetratricopeptide (TPR) repeat protein
MNRWTIAVFALLGLLPAPSGENLFSPAAAAPPLAVSADPTTAVSRLLDTAQQHVGAGRFAEALAAAERALATARTARDAASEAHAQRERAQILDRLDRTAEAVTAWRAAAAIWERLGDNSRRIEALAQAAVLLPPSDPDESKRLIEQAIALARAETQQPGAATEALQAAAQTALRRRRIDAAGLLWTTALELDTKNAPASLAVARRLNGLGQTALSRGDLTTAEARIRQALAIQEQQAPDTIDASETYSTLGIVLAVRGDAKAAAESYQRAVALLERHAPGSARLARTLSNLGLLAWNHADLPASLEYYQRALAIREKVMPGSLELAENLQDVGLIEHRRGNAAEAAVYYRRVLALREHKVPGTLPVAHALYNLAAVTRLQGDLAGARRHLTRALALYEKLSPSSRDVAQTLDRLGGVARQQEDLAAARDLHQRALAIQEKLAPGSPDEAASLHSLGLIAYQQSDLVAANEYCRRALALYDKLSPGSDDAAGVLNSLGVIAWRQGEPAAAAGYYGRGLAIQEKADPSSLDTAGLLDNLGLVARSQGDAAAGLAYHRRALALYETRSPNSLDMARCLNNVGLALQDQGDLTEAAQFCRRSLALKEKVAPGTLDLALSLRSLAELASRRRDWPEAERHARRAWEIVRGQHAAVAGDEARQAFGASAASYAELLLQAQIARGEGAAAFATMEQARAQALRQLLAERHLDTSAAPAALQAGYRAALDARDRAERLLSEASVAQARAEQKLLPAGSARAATEDRGQLQADAEAAARRFDEARSAYTQARLKADQLWAAITRRAPRAFAAPLSLDQARRALPPGSLFAAFAVGEAQAAVFLLRPGGTQPLSIYPLAETPTALRKRIMAFRQWLARPSAGVGAVTSQGRALFAALFPGDAARILRGAQRLVLSPDGPVWDVPFAALVTNPSGAPHYLGLEKALSFTPSLALFAQSRQEPRPSSPTGRLTALVVGAPIFDRGSPRTASAEAPRGERTLLLDGAPPPPLPATRRESQRIAALYGTTPLTGEEATEATLRARIPRADVVHLATHGLLNPLWAMSSGVLLTVPRTAPPPGQTANDGVLQAWEIYSRLRLRAALVVLSACDTGRGENVPGEGIIGLTRALQYAGARAIVASQWRVADTSTAALMEAFHRRLRRALPKDEALRQAMQALHTQPLTAHPYYWAPFFLIGDPTAMP